MKLRKKKQLEVEGKQEKLPLKGIEDEEKDKKKKKRVDYEGSRWTALIVLVVTIILSIVFYLQGWLSGQGMVVNRNEPQEKPSEFRGSRWEFSK